MRRGTTAEDDRDKDRDDGPRGVLQSQGRTSRLQTLARGSHRNSYLLCPFLRLLLQNTHLYGLMNVLG